ncbi:MAG: MFS transporter [Kiloniellaceae bacterium]
MSALESAAVAPVRLPLGRLLVVMGGVYTIQSTVGAVMFQGVPATLRDSGLPLDMIGLVSLFMLPWTVKFLWSPMVERWRLAVDGRRRSRQIIVSGQLVMALVLAALAWITPEGGFLWLLVGLAAIAVVASTVDIASDGYMIEHLEQRQRGWGNVVQVGGGYAGIMIGTGLFLVLVGWYGWSTAMFTMAVAALLLTVPCLLTREPPGDAERQARHRPSLAFALRRPAIRWGLVAVVLCQTGLRLIQSMTGPFMIDNGIAPAQLGFLTGTLGTLLCLSCVVLVGLPIRRWGARPTLFTLLGLQVAIYTLFCLAALAPLSAELLSALFLAKAVIIAASFVALYTVAMDWTSPRQAGIDFTLFQCADALVSVVAGLGSGLIAQHLGYGVCFALASGGALLCLLLLPAVFRRIHRSMEYDG